VLTSVAALAAMKWLHVLAAILFVGNVIVTGVWSAVMFRQRVGSDFRGAARAIVITDWIFTLGGAALLVASGVLLAAGRGYPLWATRWIRDAMLGLGLSTGVWLLVLVPAQRRMLQLGPEADAELRRVYGRWNIAGWFATVPLLWSLWCMVTKPG
jgi:uncharacterized membrane protein